MNKIFTLIGAVAFMSNALAQELPKPSPAAKVEQRVGLTDITVEYSRPGVKDRVIWGELVAYDEVWRAGANKATKLETTSDIKVNGNVLPKGSYAVFITPSERGPWTIAFNKNTEQWGTSEYNADENAFTTTSLARDVDHASERLEFHFTDVDMDGATLTMTWAGKEIDLTIEADPTEQAYTNIAKAIEEAEEDKKWRVYRSAASYAETVGNTKQGLEWIKMSTDLHESWYSYWVYAELLASSGDNEGAVSKAKMAIEIGERVAKEEGNTFGYTDRINEDIAKWSSK